MTLKNAVTKGVKAWRDRRVGYWLCIDPKTGEYYLLTSAALAELNGLKVMYSLPAVYYRVVLTRDWTVKLGCTLWEPDYAFEADNRRTLEAFCTAFGIEVTEYVYDAYHYVFYWDADPEIKEIRKPELDGYIRHRLSLFEPTGFYLDDVILGPAKQPTEGKVFGDVIEECLTAFFSACCEDVKYTQSQEYFADFAENNEFEFYENDICIRHR